jgi:hypothetical protein
MRDRLGGEFGVGERHRMAGSVACPVLLCVISASDGYGLRPDLGPVPWAVHGLELSSRVAEAEEVAGRRG